MSIVQFYIGNNGKGILYICLTLGGIITFGITSIITTILIVIDLINILTGKFKDNNGVVITDWN